MWYDFMFSTTLALLALYYFQDNYFSLVMFLSNTQNYVCPSLFVNLLLEKELEIIQNLVNMGYLKSEDKQENLYSLAKQDFSSQNIAEEKKNLWTHTNELRKYSFRVLCTLNITALINLL